MTSTSSKAIVLNGAEDWHEWLDHLKDLATAKRVWDTMNPDLADTDVVILIEPTIP